MPGFIISTPVTVPLAFKVTLAVAFAPVVENPKEALKYSPAVPLAGPYPDPPLTTLTSKIPFNP